MSNLGSYQWITTTANKFGGPKKFIALIVACSAVTGVTIYKGCETIVKKIKKNVDNKKCEKCDELVYKIIKECKSEEGVVFDINEEFIVLEVKKNTAYVVKSNDNSVYTFDKDFMMNISNYK